MRSKEEQERIVKRALSTESPVVIGTGADVVDQIIDEHTIAVLIDSTVLGAPIWFAFNDDFISGDGIPVFFASEFAFLRDMTADEIRRRYSEKRALRGGWIRDRTNGPMKQ
jgi:hypothetical protein